MSPTKRKATGWPNEKLAQCATGLVLRSLPVKHQLRLQEEQATEEHFGYFAAGFERNGQPSQYPRGGDGFATSGRLPTNTGVKAEAAQFHAFRHQAGWNPNYLTEIGSQFSEQEISWYIGTDGPDLTPSLSLQSDSANRSTAVVDHLVGMDSAHAQKSPSDDASGSEGYVVVGQPRDCPGCWKKLERSGIGLASAWSIGR